MTVVGPIDGVLKPIREHALSVLPPVSAGCPHTTLRHDWFGLSYSVHCVDGCGRFRTVYVEEGIKGYPAQYPDTPQYDMYRE